MKKLLLLVVFFISISINAQKQKATIILNDRTVKIGLAKIREMSSSVKYRKEKKGKKEIIKFNDIKSITIEEYDGEITYEIKHKKNDFYIDDDDYVTSEQNSKPIYIPYLLEVIIKGKVNLYLKENTHTNMGANGMMTGTSTSYTYYVSREDSDIVTVIAYLNTLNIGKSFKKIAMKYFNDCPELVEKIKIKEFKKRHIKEVIKFYNQCK